jgi:parallel beta-helix repeat protein
MSRGHAPTISLLLAALLAAVAATVALFVPLAGAQSDGCDYVVATGGSDQAPGTLTAPLATVDELLDRLEQGETGCLRSGTYVAEQFKVSTPEVKLTSYPGERATLRGRLRLNAGADRAVVENLLLDGRNPSDLLGPLIYADGVVLRGNEITNHNTAICVHVDDYPGESAPRGVLIENNEIHHCGRLPATNHDHGIYLANARETVIRGNLIYANADRGIQFYPNADDSLVTGNVIDGNGQGVIFGGGGSSSSDRNVVEGNVISNSKIRYNVESHWQGPTGSGNVARRNCVWSTSGKYSGKPEGSGIEPSMSGASASDNVIAEPGAANQASPGAGTAACGDLLSSWSGGKGKRGSGGGKKGGTQRARCGALKAQSELLVGTRAGDRLRGGVGNQRIRGMSGNDRIKAGPGRDCLLGDRGRDRLHAADARRDVVRCGRGRDVAIVDRKDRVRHCEKVVRG